MHQEVINYILQLDIDSYRTQSNLGMFKINIYDSSGGVNQYTLDELETLQKRLVNNENFHGDVESLLKG